MESSILNLCLRPVQESDTELLLAIYASTRAEELAHVPWTDAQKEGFVRMQFDAQRKYYQSEYPGAEFQIIMAGDQPAGRLYVHRRDREIRIMDIALLPAYRGHGIGTDLLSELLEEGRQTARAVSIHVESFNRAHRLYERLGFKRVASNGVYHLMEWTAVPEKNA